MKPLRSLYEWSLTRIPTGESILQVSMDLLCLVWRAADKLIPDVETNEGPSRDYGFPEGEEDLLDDDGQPLDTTLLRCFPEVGVFSLRDKAWGKCTK